MRTKGFTLLELLVALALMGILAAALYGTYFSLASARDRGEEVAERSRELRTTLDGLRREIASAWYRPPADPAKPLFRFVVEDRDFFGKPASILTFSTISPPAAGSFPASDQMEVEYRPEEKGEAMDLMRRTKEVYVDVPPAPYPQLEGMESFLVECYDGSKWGRTWDTRLNGGRLPTQVRVTVRVKEGEKTVPYVAVVSPRT